MRSIRYGRFNLKLDASPDMNHTNTIQYNNNGSNPGGAHEGVVEERIDDAVWRGAVDLHWRFGLGARVCWSRFLIPLMHSCMHTFIYTCDCSNAQLCLRGQLHAYMSMPHMHPSHIALTSSHVHHSDEPNAIIFYSGTCTFS